MKTIKKLENIYCGQKILDLGVSIYYKKKVKGCKSLQWRKVLVMALCSLEARKMGLEIRHRI